MKKTYIPFRDKKKARDASLKSKKLMGIELRTDINITAIAALLISIATATYQFGINFRHGINLMPTRQVQFFEENSILKFAMFLNYINNNSDGDSPIIDSEQVEIKIGSTELPFDWKFFTNYNSAEGKLKSDKFIEASAFIVKAGESTSHETTFLPSDRLQKTPTMKDFIVLVNSMPLNSSIDVNIKYHIHGEKGEKSQHCKIQIDKDFRDYLITKAFIVPYCK